MNARAQSTPPAPAACPEDIARFKKGYERYEKARRISPRDWIELHKRNLGGQRFDAMIDALP